MQIDIIDTLPSLAKAQRDWNAVYDADSEAQIFLSWSWLNGWLSHIKGPWFILAARASADAPYVAFFPLRLQATIDAADVTCDIRMAGNYGADYTGLICLPEAEGAAIAAFARHIKRLNWARLNLENVRISPRRLRYLMAHFSLASFRVTEIDRVGKIDGIDNSVCPHTVLPADWNAYMESLSANTRQKIRRLLRLIDNPSEYRITVATAETFDGDLDTLLKYWETKWRPRKAHLIDGLVQSNRMMLTRSFRAGLVFLPTFWHGDRPVAALATLVDRRKRTFSFYMTGRDETFDGPPPGVILHAFSIRHAIDSGFSEYDFLRGNEPYKYSFGCAERKIHCTVVTTRTGTNLGGRLDRRSIPDVLYQATKLHKKSQSAEAEVGYRKILDIEPRHADALHQLGQLLAAKKGFAEAKALFRKLTIVRPEAAKAWLCIGQVCEALGQHDEALRHYVEFMRLQPRSSEAFVGVARNLVKLGRIAEVNAALLETVGCAIRPSVRGWRDQIKPRHFDA